MNTITLILISAGDTLGELPIANLLIGIDAVSPSDRFEVPAHQASCIFSQLIDALSREGYAPVGDEIDFRLAVSRELVTAPDEGVITIPISVVQTGSSLRIDPDELLTELPENVLDFADLFAGSESEGSGSDDSFDIF